MWKKIFFKRLKISYFMQLPIFIMIVFISGCAKMSYLSEQSMGQMKLQWKGQPVSEVINDNKTHPEHKKKLILILKAKEFFKKYLSKDPGNIYSKVVFLDQEAVTYLVVASPFDEIKALQHNFIFMGSFPYLGFFKLSSAKNYAQKLEEDQYFTTVRPVYAYSTLGHFEDRILSSFFYIDDIELVETIYHELFHMIFFVKNEVDFNENLASFFARKLLKITPFLDQSQVDHYLKHNAQVQIMIQSAVELIREYALAIKSNPPKNKAAATEYMNQFLAQKFNPQIYKVCQENSLIGKDCSFFGKNWNNASFAALLTYEKDQQYWEKWWDLQIGMTPKVFIAQLEKTYEQFLDQKEDDQFENYFKKLNKLK